MKIIEVLNALKSRTSIRVARRLLAQNGFPRGQGWDQIEEKLKSTKVAAKADSAGLENALKELLFVGDKNVRVYKLSNGGMVELRRKAAKLSINKSGVFATHFPASVPEKLLQSLPTQNPIAICKIETPEAIAILYSSVKIIETREKLNPSHLKANVAGYYDELIGIKQSKIQAFDAVIVSKKAPYVYCLTDAYQDSTASFRNALQATLVPIVNQIAGRKVLGKPENLFPVIDPLYKGGQGFVKTLFWTTTTSSGKHEWMRSTGQCLRDEIAHKAAMGVIGKGFTTYGLEVGWLLDEVEGYSPTPLLSILGLYRMTYEAKPQLPDASVWGCATFDELFEVLGEMMVHVHGSKIV